MLFLAVKKQSNFLWIDLSSKLANNSKLTNNKYKKRLNNNFCLYCGNKGYNLDFYSKKQTIRVVNDELGFYSSVSFIFLFCFFFYFILGLSFFFFILDLSKEYDVMLYIMITQVTKCDRSMISVTVTGHTIM